MASIRKRTWTAPDGTEKTAWIVDYRDGAGARRFKQFPRRKDADSWLTSAAWQVSQGTHTADSQSVTVAQAAEIWIKGRENKGRERGTIAQYRQLTDLHIVPLIGAEKLSKLTQPKVVAFVETMLETRSEDLTHKAVRALSRILSDAGRRGLVAQNVARDVKVEKSKREEGEVIIPPKEDLRAMLAAAEDDMKPFMLTAILTGLRVSELRGLRWEDIDFKGKAIKVKQRADKHCQIGPPKSKAGYRTIPIGAAVIGELRKWKLQCPNGPLGLVFPASGGQVQDYGNLLRRKFYPLQIKAGVCDPIVKGGKPVPDAKGNATSEPRYGFHALRHAAASAWIAQKIDLKRLTTWLGHSSVATTLDLYGHLIVDKDEDARLAAEAQAALLA
ncbi:site-specific integrase [Sphingopyxis lindanitolerans]|uniref:Site-specific integrase n=1 Tax=Sphingopyxis lindanitolerans TaxID=2054227 RepID=A0A2S8B5I0_9SPHN|nr:site-specific integrase [Sphingopyxis lindanitolerans]PQM27662.1 site-specific integrase [Sphingopyxis lindanitolerans]